MREFLAALARLGALACVRGESLSQAAILTCVPVVAAPVNASLCRLRWRAGGRFSRCLSDLQLLSSARVESVRPPDQRRRHMERLGGLLGQLLGDGDQHCRVSLDRSPGMLSLLMYRVVPFCQPRDFCAGGRVQHTAGAAADDRVRECNAGAQARQQCSAALPLSFRRALHLIERAEHKNNGPS